MDITPRPRRAGAYLEIDGRLRKNLIRLMEIRDIRPMQLSKKSKVGHPTIYEILLGSRKNLGLHIIDRLADGLEVDTSLLLVGFDITEDTIKLFEALKNPGM